MAGSSDGNPRGFTSLWIVRERPALGNQTNNGGRPILFTGTGSARIIRRNIEEAVHLESRHALHTTQNIATEPIAYGGTSSAQRGTRSGMRLTSAMRASTTVMTAICRTSTKTLKKDTPEAIHGPLPEVPSRARQPCFNHHEVT